MPVPGPSFPLSRESRNAKRKELYLVVKAMDSGSAPAPYLIWGPERCNASSLISCDSIWSASTDAVQLRPYILVTLRVAGLASRAGSSPEPRR